MKNVTQLLSILLVFVLAASAGAQDADGTDQTVEHEFLGMKLQLAPGWWGPVEGNYSDDERVLLASDGTPEEQGLLLISRLPGLNRTLEAFATTTRNYVLTKMDGFVEHEDHLEVGGSPAYLMIYQGKSTVDSNGWRKFYRVTVERSGDFLVFQGVMDEKYFPKHRGAFESMIKSIVWID